VGECGVLAKLSKLFPYFLDLIKGLKSIGLVKELALPLSAICEKHFFIRITSNGLLFVYLNLFCLDLEWTPAEEKRRSSSMGWPAFCFEEWNLS
jgi:hypothetical protein